MKVNTAKMRRSHVDGWKPRQTVSIDVETLKALLDELDELRELTGEPRCELCGEPGAIKGYGDDAADLCGDCRDDLADEYGESEREP
jgi:hypothetical protein